MNQAENARAGSPIGGSQFVTALANAFRIITLELVHGMQVYKQKVVG